MWHHFKVSPSRGRLPPHHPSRWKACFWWFWPYLPQGDNSLRHWVICQGVATCRFLNSRSLWAKEHSSHVNGLTNSTEKHYLDFRCKLPRVQKVENGPNTIKEKLSPVAKMYIPLPPTQIFSQSWTLCFTQSPNKFCHPLLEPPGG